MTSFLPDDHQTSSHVRGRTPDVLVQPDTPGICEPPQTFGERQNAHRR